MAPPIKQLEAIMKKFIAALLLSSISNLTVVNADEFHNAIECKKIVETQHPPREHWQQAENNEHWSEYEAHYNMKDHRCYKELSAWKGHELWRVTLSDAVEGSLLAVSNYNNEKYTGGMVFAPNANSESSEEFIKRKTTE